MRDASGIDFGRADTRTMWINPKLAEEWLTRNTSNRTISAQHVAELAHDMRLGRWRLTHQGIAFDIHGRLADGQHRLLAVVMAGVSVQMQVTTMLSPEAVANIDIQRRRTLSDAMELSGREHLARIGVTSAKSNAATWRCMRGGLRQGLKTKATHEELFEFADTHQAAGVWAINEFGRHRRMKQIHVAPAMAAVARAFYFYRDNLPKLSRFVSLLCTGMGADSRSEDNTVILLRNVLLDLRRNSNGAGEVYGKTAAALIAFMQGRVLSQIKALHNEPFPLAEDGSSDTGRTDRMALDLGRSGTGRSRAGAVADRAATSLLA